MKRLWRMGIFLLFAGRQGRFRGLLPHNSRVRHGSYSCITSSAKGFEAGAFALPRPIVGKD